MIEVIPSLKIFPSIFYFEFLEQGRHLLELSKYELNFKSFDLV
jgi:hypothetical protein